MKRWFSYVGFGLLLGCAAKTPAVEAPPVPPPPPPAAAPEPEPVATEATVTDATRSFARLERVYFEFDRSRLTTAAQETLVQNAEVLRARPEIVIEIQGHADERGTGEYNMALGERRAQSVRTYLKRLGIDRNRMTIISYGEEIPLEEGSGEEIWSRNRRAEFRVVEGGADIGTVE